MDAHYPTADVPATPEYVLEVFRDWHARLAEVGQADTDLHLTFETTVRDFRASFIDATWEPWSWRGVADALNTMWEVDVPKAEWEAVLLPARERTLGDVCRLLAGHVRREVIRPWRHVAGECLPAGAFLTIRSLLAWAGVNPAAVTPSAALEPHLLTFRLDSELEWRLSRLAPGRVPAVGFTFRPWWVRLLANVALAPIAALVLVWGVALVILSTLNSDWAFSVVSLGVCWLACRGIRWHGRLTRPTEATLGDLRTFRDLSYALAGQRPRRSIQPTP